MYVRSHKAKSSSMLGRPGLHQNPLPRVFSSFSQLAVVLVFLSWLILPGVDARGSVTVNAWYVRTISRAFAAAQGITLATNVDLYVADTTANVIRKTNHWGSFTTTVAGSTQGNVQAQGTSAKFDRPGMIAYSPLVKWWFVSQRDSHLIRWIDTNLNVDILIGSYNSPGNAAKKLNGPTGVVVPWNQPGMLYWVETFACILRSMDITSTSSPANRVTGTYGSCGFFDGGDKTTSLLNGPQQIAGMLTGDILVADTLNYRLRRVVVSTGQTQTYACTGVSTYLDGPRLTAGCHYPYGLAVSPYSGMIIFTEYQRHTIRKIVSDVVTTIAGTAGTAGDKDGWALTSILSNPWQIGFSWSDLAFYVTQNNARMYKVSQPTPTETPSLTVTTSVSLSSTFTRVPTPPPTPTNSLTDEQTMSFSASEEITATKSYGTFTLSPTMTYSLSATLSTSLSVSLSQSTSMSLTTSLSLTPTVTQIPTMSPSEELSLTQTVTAPPTASTTPTFSYSMTRTKTPPPTASSTPTMSFSFTPSVTPPPTATRTLTITPPLTPTGSKSGATGSGTPTDELTATRSITFSSTETEELSLSSTMSSSTTITISKTATPPPTGTVSLTLSTSLSLSLSAPTLSGSPSATLSVSRGTFSEEKSATHSLTEDSTASRTLTLTPVPTPSTSTTLSLPPTLTESISGSFTLSQSISASLSTSVSLTQSLSTTMTASLSASTSMSQSVTFTRTKTPPPTPTVSRTLTLTMSGDTLTLSGTMTVTASMSITASASNSMTSTLSLTPGSSTGSTSFSLTLTKTKTPPPTPTPSFTTTLTQSNPTVSLSATWTATLSSTVTTTVSSTISVTAGSKTLTRSRGTFSPSFSLSGKTPSVTSSTTASITLPPTRSISLTRSVSTSFPSPSETFSEDISSTATATPPPTTTASQTITVPATVSDTLSGSFSSTLSMTAGTSTMTLTPGTPTYTTTGTISPSIHTWTPTPSRFPTLTAPMTPSPTISFSDSPTVTLTLTQSPSVSTSQSLTTSLSASPSSSMTLSRSHSLSITPPLTLSVSITKSQTLSLSTSLSQTPTPPPTPTPSLTITPPPTPTISKTLTLTPSDTYVARNITPTISGSEEISESYSDGSPTYSLSETYLEHLQTISLPIIVQEPYPEPVVAAASSRAIREAASGLSQPMWLIIIASSCALFFLCVILIFFIIVRLRARRRELARKRLANHLADLEAGKNGELATSSDRSVPPIPKAEGADDGKDSDEDLTLDDVEILAPQDNTSGETVWLDAPISAAGVGPAGEAPFALGMGPNRVDLDSAENDDLHLDLELNWEVDNGDEATTTQFVVSKPSLIRAASISGPGPSARSNELPLFEMSVEPSTMGSTELVCAKTDDPGFIPESSFVEVPKDFSSSTQQLGLTTMSLLTPQGTAPRPTFVHETEAQMSLMMDLEISREDFAELSLAAKRAGPVPRPPTAPPSSTSSASKSPPKPPGFTPSTDSLVPLSLSNVTMKPLQLSVIMRPGSSDPMIPLVPPDEEPSGFAGHALLEAPERLVEEEKEGPPPSERKESSSNGTADGPKEVEAASEHVEEGEQEEEEDFDFGVLAAGKRRGTMRKPVPSAQHLLNGVHSLVATLPSGEELKELRIDLEDLSAPAAHPTSATVEALPPTDAITAFDDQPKSRKDLTARLGSALAVSRPARTPLHSIPQEALELEEFDAPANETANTNATGVIGVTSAVSAPADGPERDRRRGSVLSDDMDFSSLAKGKRKSIRKTVPKVQRKKSMGQILSGTTNEKEQREEQLAPTLFLPPAATATTALQPSDSLWIESDAPMLGAAAGTKPYLSRARITTAEKSSKKGRRRISSHIPEELSINEEEEPAEHPSSAKSSRDGNRQNLLAVFGPSTQSLLSDTSQLEENEFGSHFGAMEPVPFEGLGDEDFLEDHESLVAKELAATRAAKQPQLATKSTTSTLPPDELLDELDLLTAALTAASRPTSKQNCRPSSKAQLEKPQRRKSRKRDSVVGMEDSLAFSFALPPLEGGPGLSKKARGASFRKKSKFPRDSMVFDPEELSVPQPSKPLPPAAQVSSAPPPLTTFEMPVSDHSTSNNGAEDTSASLQQQDPLPKAEGPRPPRIMRLPTPQVQKRRPRSMESSRRSIVSFPMELEESLPGGTRGLEPPRQAHAKSSDHLPRARPLAEDQLELELSLEGQSTSSNSPSLRRGSTSFAGISVAEMVSAFTQRKEQRLAQALVSNNHGGSSKPEVRAARRLAAKMRSFKKWRKDAGGQQQLQPEPEGELGVDVETNGVENGVEQVQVTGSPLSPQKSRSASPESKGENPLSIGEDDDEDGDDVDFEWSFSPPASQRAATTKKVPGKK